MIVVFGSVNLDLIFEVPALPAAGQTLIAPTLRIEPGGKGANQAVAAARDGAKTAFAGAVGQDALAAQATAGLVAAGIDCANVVTVAATTGCAAITVDADGRNHIIVAAGANHLARAAQVEDALLDADTVLLLQMENDPAETASLISRARARGARIILNLAPAGPLPSATLREVDILVVNEDEAAWLGQHLGAGSDAAALAQALGVAVVRTLGGAGVEASGAGGAVRLAAGVVAVVDTTAAGDCFVGVLAAGLDRGLGWRAALARANVAAGLCCACRGTQSSLPSREEIDQACAASKT